MNDSPRIYIDLDDVLCETALMLTRLVNREFNKDVRFDEIVSFDLAASFSLNKKEEARLFEMFHDADILQSLEPVGGALEAVREFETNGFDVHVVTGRPPTTHAASMEWLRQREVPHVDLTFVDKYLRGHAHVDDVTTLSLDELKDLHFALAIEDSLTMARFLAGEMDLPVLLLDRPWNGGDIAMPPSSRGAITRCNGWSEAVKMGIEILNTQ